MLLDLALGFCVGWAVRSLLRKKLVDPHANCPEGAAHWTTCNLEVPDNGR